MFRTTAASGAIVVLQCSWKLDSSTAMTSHGGAVATVDDDHLRTPVEKRVRRRDAGRGDAGDDNSPPTEGEGSTLGAGSMHGWRAGRRTSTQRALGQELGVEDTEAERHGEP